MERERHTPESVRLRRYRRERLRTVLNPTIYKLFHSIRRERSVPGEEVIEVTHAAKEPALIPDEEYHLLVWNVLKGKRPEFISQFIQSAKGNHLVCCQEFTPTPFLADWFTANHMTAAMAYNYYTEDLQKAPAGVFIGSTVIPAELPIGLSSPHQEPFLGIGKTGLYIELPIANSEQRLGVINMHGSNFIPTWGLTRQMEFAEAIITGDDERPFLWLGDFNVRNPWREAAIRNFMQRHHMERVKFPPGVKSLWGYELDQVYARGLKISHQEVIKNRRASDHNGLSFTFRV